MFKKFKDKLKGDDHPADEKKQHGPSYQQSDLHPSNPYYAPAQHQQTGSHSNSSNEKYQSPPGPPPGHGAGSSYAPPPGPPPSNSNFPQQPPPSWEPPPYHDWTVIPDTALLPPPPSIGYDYSPSANASRAEGDNADMWCKANPLWPPQNLAPQVHTAIQNGQLALLRPWNFSGNVTPMQQAGHWKAFTNDNCRDSALLTNLPMYSVFWDSPLNTERPKTIYFELKVLRMSPIHPSRFRKDEAESGGANGVVGRRYST